MNIAERWDEGAKAFLAGKSESDNPYDAFSQAEHFSAWQHGFRMERMYQKMAADMADDTVLRF